MATSSVRRCGLLLWVAFAALMLLHPLPPGAGTAMAQAVPGVTVVAAGLAMAVRARRGDRCLRRPRALLGAAMLCAALGAALASAVVALHGRPVQVAFVPLAVAGLLSYPLSDHHAGSIARTLLDGLLAASSLWFVGYALVLQPTSTGLGLPGLDAAVALAGPMADVLVLAMCAGLLSRVPAQARHELALGCGGLGLYGVADVARCVYDAAGTRGPESWVAVVAEGGLLLLLAGAVGRVPAPRAAARWTRAYGALPFLPLAAALAVAANVGWRGLQMSREQSLVAVLVVLLALLVLRQLVGTRDRNVMNERLRAREQMFRSLVTGSQDLITLHDTDGNVRYASPAVSRATGLVPEGLTVRALRQVVHPDDLPLLVSAERHVLGSAGSTAEVAVRLRNPSGEWRWHQTEVRNALDEPGARGIVINGRDVHERHLLELQVAHSALHDALTGLGNLAHARALLAAVCAGPEQSTVVLVDLDGFKAVNDTFGHAAGDALLRDVAVRLTTCVRDEGEVTRIGGDEFLLVLRGGADSALIAERVLAALRLPVVVAGHPLNTGASLGLATTQDAATPEELLRNADLAMYAAKGAGRGRASWYERSMHDAAAQRMQVQRGLRKALDDGDLVLHYQPIVQLPGGQVTGLEALLRWTDPELGVVGPDVFIPVAEGCGLMPEIDAWVLDQACRDLRSWGPTAVPVSVNVSRLHLTDDLPGLVCAALARYDVPSNKLCLEVTESAVVPDPEKALAVLQAIRALGVRLSLDDFGTGQSSLSQLARLPVDTVKIDKSFVLSSSRDVGSRRLLVSIIGVCGSLGLPVVAEGIEDASVVASLAASGCAFGQGYHFGRPGPASLVPGLLRQVLPAQRGPMDELAPTLR